MFKCYKVKRIFLLKILLTCARFELPCLHVVEQVSVKVETEHKMYTRGDLVAYATKIIHFCLQRLSVKDI